MAPSGTPVFVFASVRSRSLLLRAASTYARTAAACSARDQLRDERMLRREDDVRHAGQRVGARREDANRAGRAGTPDDVEVDLRALAAADPVVLLGLRRSGPVEALEVGVEAIGVRGDLEHPLPQRHALDGVPSALALAVDDLLVREHGPELRRTS